jgi:two-component system copper resistance phosphate regulon response regulator CusR
MTILIVEDEEKTADYLRKGLQEAGYPVQVASTGHEGRQLIAQERYELVVLDVMLPGVDGWELLRLLRRSAGTR